jgi:phosphoglycerate dehydrogenase-like enzyme
MLREMRPGVSLVNVARGGIVDEEALVRALRDGSIGSAAVDVFSREPLPPESPLWDAPNLLITPHVAGGFPDFLDRVAQVFRENVRRVEVGMPVLNRVDRDRGY